MTRIIAVVNQKGGVGKTTTAVNLSACLAASEHKTLLIDLDPQSNATSGAGVQLEAEDSHAYHVLIGDKAAVEVIRTTSVPNLDVLPAGRDLIGAEIELINIMARETRLSSALSDLGDVYDYILIDCPPSLGVLTINALTAAQSVLIPVQTEYYAMEGVGHLMHTIDLVRRHINSKLEIEGVLLTMADFRTNLSRQVADEMRGFFGDKVYQTVIYRNVRLSESPSHGRPILMYDITSKGSENYLSLAEEFLINQKSGV